MNKQETTKEKSTVPVARATKVWTKVLCSCKKCDGKMVDPRIRQKYELEENRLQASISNMKEDREKRVKSTPINLPNSKSVLIDIEPMVAGYSQNLRENVIDSDHYQSDDEVEPVIIRKKQKRHDWFCETIETIIILDEVPAQEVSSDDEKGSHLLDDDINDDELFFDEDEVDIFATPDSLNFNYDSDQEHPNTNTNMNNSWILLWIFKFQERFRLSDVTINSLVGFFSLVLKDVNS